MASSSLSPENDDMASLFEGMVLFTPPSHPYAQEHQSSAATPESHTSSSSVPLDENLFSDLTVVAPSAGEFPAKEPPHSSPSTQRQISIRKKKRASGLRIGYGRDRDAPPPAVVPNSDPYSEFDELKEKELKDYQLSSPTIIDHNPSPANHQIDTDLCLEDANVSDADTAVSPSSSRGDLQRFENQEDENEQDTRTEVKTGDKCCSSIEFRFQEIHIRIANKLNHAREVVASEAAARKACIKRRRKAAEILSLASAKFGQLEKELEEACETEDFEKAERVSENLSSSEKEREHLIAALREAEADCDTVEFKLKEALECQIQAEEECSFLLQSFALDASKHVDLLLENAKEISFKDMEEWLQSTEGVDLYKMGLEVESFLISEARLALNNCIEHSLEDDQRKRDHLYKRREMLKDDLEKLLALVKEKEAEISETNLNIDRVEKRMDGVISGFQEACSLIDAKYNNLQSALSHMQLECEILSKRKNEIENLLCQEETHGAKVKEISRKSTEESNMFEEVVLLRKNLLQYSLQFMEDKLRLAKTEENLAEDVIMLRREISNARASLQELSSQKLSIQQEVESLKQRLLFIEKRVPELEAEKKVAATARNFKEAARISMEAKTLCVEKEGLEPKIDSTELELKKIEEQICNTIDGLQETESQVLLKEKDWAMVRFQRLTLLANASMAERSAALEFGDLDEADALLVEAETSSAEARKLQPLYSFGEEDFTNLSKHFAPMELVAKLETQQLVKLLASIHT